MIVVDVARGVIIASIPLFAIFGKLSIWWIYVVGFLSSTLLLLFYSIGACGTLLAERQRQREESGRECDSSYCLMEMPGNLLISLCRSDLLH